MLNSKSFNSVLGDLENHNGEFIDVLDKFIKLAVNKFTTTDELREEIVDYEDIYQILITDINFNFWLNVSKGSIIYKKGVNRNASFKVKYTKDIIIKILKREMYGTDAYMKGIIKVNGDLSQGLRYIKLFRILIEYLNNGFKK
jgi:hypothetical protein